MRENEIIRRAFDSHYENKVKGVFGGEADKILDETKKNQSVSLDIK